MLPLDGHCPACFGALHWQDLIRAAYRRQEEANGNGRKKMKRLVPLRGIQVTPTSSQVEVEVEDEDEDEDEDENENEDRFAPSDVGEDHDGDEAERSFAFNQERSWAQMDGQDEDHAQLGGFDSHYGMHVDHAGDDDASSGILVFEPTPSPPPPTPQPRKAQDDSPRPAPRTKKARSPVQQTLSNRSTKPGLTEGGLGKKPARPAVPPPARKVYTVLTSSDEGEEAEVAFRPVELGGEVAFLPELEVDFEPVGLVTATQPEAGCGVEKGRRDQREVEGEAGVARPRAKRLGPRKKEVEVMVLSDSD